MGADLYLDAATRELSLSDLKRLFVEAGAQRLHYKILAANNNSKQQIYVGGGKGGGGAEQTRPIPTGPWSKLPGTSTKGGKEHGPILQATIDWHWLRLDGRLIPAPEAKMILYPQYGNEFRLSGFLEGAADRPSTLLNKDKRGAEPGRVMFFGIVGSKVIVFLAPAEARCAKEATADRALATVGVLTELQLKAGVHPEATRAEIISAIREVHLRGWRPSRLLKADGRSVKIAGNTAIGQTLLAELGVPADAKKTPDYRGWEVKSYTLPKCASRASPKVSLMTTEPTGGYYGVHGALAFLKRYGSPTEKRPDVLYFEGSHRYGIPQSKRKTTLILEGYDPASGSFDTSGGLRLLDSAGELAAEWGFEALIEHWRDKHRRAVFVPGIKSGSPELQFSYCPAIHIVEGNPFVKMLRTMFAGKIVYDPGTRYDPTAKQPLKPRNQFRITVPACLELIYDRVDRYVDVRPT